MNIYLVTKNLGKLAAAQSVFNDSEITLLPVDKDYPEIQADSSIEVARYTSLEVAKEKGLPAIREDHSIFISALGNTPGPFMSYFEKKVSADLLLQLLLNAEDRKGYFEVGTALAYPDGEVQEFVFRVPFTLAKEKRGTLQNGWNQLIILDGETRTLAEYPEIERLHIWNQSYLKIKSTLKTRLPSPASGSRESCLTC